MCRAVKLKAENRNFGWRRTTVGNGRTNANFCRKAQNSHCARPAKSTGKKKNAPVAVSSAILKMNQASVLDRPGSRTQQIVPSQRSARGVCGAIWGRHDFSRADGLALFALRAAAQRHFGRAAKASACQADGVSPSGLEAHRCRCLRQPPRVRHAASHNQPKNPASNSSHACFPRRRQRGGWAPSPCCGRGGRGGRGGGGGRRAWCAFPGRPDRSPTRMASSCAALVICSCGLCGRYFGSGVGLLWGE